MTVALHETEDAPYRSLEDIGIRVPQALPDPGEEMRALVARLAGITRGAGIVMAAAEVAKDPSAKLRTVLALLKLLAFGRAQQTIDEAVAAAPKLGCGKGCSWCCHQAVEVTIPEAILVAAHVADPADPRHRAILAEADARAKLDTSRRYRLGRPCPLLADHQCSVYEDRPLMCRAMLATDGERCRQALEKVLAGGEEEASIESFPFVQYFLLGDQAGIRGLCKDMGLQHDLVELVEAVAAILRDPPIVDRWIAGEPAFGPELVRD
jgi:Fe-S-cluster containining protein